MLLCKVSFWVHLWGFLPVHCGVDCGSPSSDRMRISLFNYIIFHIWNPSPVQSVYSPSLLNKPKGILPAGNYQVSYHSRRCVCKGVHGKVLISDVSLFSALYHSCVLYLPATSLVFLWKHGIISPYCVHALLYLSCLYALINFLCYVIISL